MLWRKTYEVQDGHQTGRWQWKFDGDEFYREAFYPGTWLFGDAICPPPGCGRAPAKRRRGDEAKYFLGPIGPPEEEDDHS